MTDQKEAGRAALVAAGANAFGVSATARGDGTLIQALPMRPLTRLEVANLSAWLTMVAMLTDADILPTLKQHGYVLPDERQPDRQVAVWLHSEAQSAAPLDDIVVSIMPGGRGDWIEIIRQPIGELAQSISHIVEPRAVADLVAAATPASRPANDE